MATAELTRVSMWYDQRGTGDPCVLLHPGAGWGAKCWPLERYAEAATLLAEAGPVQVLVSVVVRISQ